MFRYVRRALWLAFFLFLGSAANVSAHSLPGSVLIVSKTEAAIEIELQLSLDDLIFVIPAVSALEDVDPEQGVPEQHFTPIKQYFAKHILLNSGDENLQLKLSKIVLNWAENDHVGKFVQLTADMSAENTIGSGPLSLAYDAIMHEIRSHTATIYQKEPNGDFKGIADIRYNFKDGTPEFIQID